MLNKNTRVTHLQDPDRDKGMAAVMQYLSSHEAFFGDLMDMYKESCVQTQKMLDPEFWLKIKYSLMISMTKLKKMAFQVLVPTVRNFNITEFWKKVVPHRESLELALVRCGEGCRGSGCSLPEHESARLVHGADLPKTHPCGENVRYVLALDIITNLLESVSVQKQLSFAKLGQVHALFVWDGVQITSVKTHECGFFALLNMWRLR